MPRRETPPKKSLTPAEIFDHRLAALFGRSVQEVHELLTPAEYELWQRYWLEEPWGSYRDNLHTAIIAREIQRPQLKPGSKVDINQFMVRRPLQQAQNRVTSFIRTLFAMSKPVPKPGSKP